MFCWLLPVHVHTWSHILLILYVIFLSVLNITSYMYYVKNLVRIHVGSNLVWSYSFGTVINEVYEVWKYVFLVFLEIRKYCLPCSQWQWGIIDVIPLKTRYFVVSAIEWSPSSPHRNYLYNDLLSGCSSYKIKLILYFNFIFVLKNQGILK